MPASQILVDTSIWIEFFRGSLTPQTRTDFSALLEIDQVYITDIIHHEILVGSQNKSEYEELDTMLKILPHFRISESEEDEFNAFAFKVRKAGLGGTYTDLTIAFIAHTKNIGLASYDHYFKKLADKKYLHLVEL